MRKSASFWPEQGRQVILRFDRVGVHDVLQQQAVLLMLLLVRQNRFTPAPTVSVFPQVARILIERA